MAVTIDNEKCSSCGICVENCPGDVFTFDQAMQKVSVARIIRCWYCGTCEVDCSQGAIAVELELPPMAVV